MEKKNTGDRYIVMIIFVVALMLAIVVRLFDLQIVQGEDYRKQSEKRLIRSAPIKAPRGEILDRYGRPLVTNRMGFTIMFQKEYIKDEELDRRILDTIALVENNGESYFDTLPITKYQPYEFTFPEAENEEALQQKINSFKESVKIDTASDMQQTIEGLKKYYKIGDGYDNDQLRKIIGVRYEMEKRMFNVNTPYTFATDVSIETVTMLREQSGNFVGVDVSVEPIRHNVNGKLAAHILGRVGIMYKEEYEQLQGQNYNMNDTIGKDGIEKVYEQYLKGTDGQSSIIRTIDGRRSNTLQSVEAIPGGYVILTLDAELQRVLEESLARTIRNISSNNESFGASAGSAVVIDVNSGEILAMASYPDFDPATFNSDYTSLSNNKDKPMWNRAVSGQYAPGSTFKMLTSIAALEEGVVTPNDSIEDKGIYKFYEKSNYTPACWIFTETGKTHGWQNASQALENSCNYYFYEISRLLGIDNLEKYGKMFGLGDYTGIEIPGEAKGVFASKTGREERGMPWYPGDTIQAGIGQSDHLFTPLQLANYIATLANGGTRYKARLVKDVKSYENDKSLVEIQPEIVYDIHIDPENLKAVKDGMRKVSETGTASNVFADFEIPVGGKTGTASVSKGTATGLFVAFAPFDNPQIAISVVVEHGGHGNYVAPIARDVIEKYMNINYVEDQIPSYNQLKK